MRCRNFANIALPKVGGIEDQDELTMQCFDIIHGAVEKDLAEKREDEIRSAEQKMRVARLTGR